MAEKKLPKQGIRVTDIWISILCPNDFCNEKFRVHMRAARTSRNCPYCLKSTAVVEMDWQSRRGWLIAMAITLDVNNHPEPYVVDDEDIDFDIPTDDVVG
jgi:hypothetical protein